MNRKHFCKVQTKYVRRPAVIEMRSHEECIGIGIWPEVDATERRGQMPAIVFLTPQEAMAAAAWLSDAAERMRAKVARAAARKAAWLAKRGTKP